MSIMRTDELPVYATMFDFLYNLCYFVLSKSLLFHTLPFQSIPIRMNHKPKGSGRGQIIVDKHILWIFTSFILTCSPKNKHLTHANFIKEKVQNYKFNISETFSFPTQPERIDLHLLSMHTTLVSSTSWKGEHSLIFIFNFV